MYEYSRDVFYYETDKMGVVHHSNYARWVEEARTFYFAEIGLAYENTEALGVYSPVTELNLKFKHYARFGDRMTVRLKMTKYTGVRFFVAYEIVNQDGAVLVEGSSGHAFVDTEFKPVSMARVIPEKHEEMKKHVSP